MLFDLHVHTTFSPCSGLSLEEILGKARSIGLDGVCLTDHESMAAGGLVREGPQDDGLCVIIGQEYATRQGDFLLFGPYESLPQGLEARHLLLYVQATGGVAVAAHPCRLERPVDGSILRSGLCRVLERQNGRNTLLENKQATRCMQSPAMSSVGGSDAHSLEELGRVAVRFDQAVHSREDLIRLLTMAEGVTFPCQPAPELLSVGCPAL